MIKLYSTVRKLRERDITQTLEHIAKLEAINKPAPTFQCSTELREARNKLSSLLFQNYHKSLLRLRSKYYSQSNKAGRLLAQQLKTQQAKSKISHLLHPINKAKLTDPREIANQFKIYYQTLYNLKDSTPHPDNYSNLVENFLIKQATLPTLTQTQLQSLNAPFSLAEINKIVMSLQMGKSPGPDGLSNEYYRHFQHILAPYMLEMFKSVQGGTNSHYPKTWQSA